MPSPEEDPILIEILDEMQNQFHCHTAILYGSRARGDHTPHSDYDIIALKNDSPNTSHTLKKGPFFVDAYIYSENFPQENLKDFLRIRGAKVLFQKGNLGTKLIAQVEALYRKGPPQLAPDEIQQRKIWIEKTLIRAQRGDIEANFRLHWLLNDLLPIYFELRNLWYRGPKESFEWLRHKDFETYNLFENALRPQASEKHIRKLCLRVLDSSPELLNSPIIF